MADSLSIAGLYAASLSDATQQTLQLQMLRQQADAGQAVVALLQESVEQQKATLPAGQGESVDITA